MAEPLQGTASAATAIDRVKYTHDGLIDLMLHNPMVSQGKLAEMTGYTQAWLSRVMNSDAFLARLAARKEELVDPSIRQSIEEKFRALADMSLDIVHEKLALTRSADMAFKGIEAATKALGYGARQANVTNVQQNFVVAMPQQISDTEDWASKYRAKHGAGDVVDVGAESSTATVTSL